MQIAGRPVAEFVQVGRGYSAFADFTPAAAAYGAGDIMSVAQEMTWLDVNGARFRGGPLKIINTTLLVAHTDVISGETSYSAKLYNVTPPSARADNAAWDIAAGDRAAYQGALALGTPADVGASLYIEVVNVQKIINVLATGKTWAELVTVGAFTATTAARKMVVFAEAI